jgi:hypothetical protein
MLRMWRRDLSPILVVRVRRLSVLVVAVAAVDAEDRAAVVWLFNHPRDPDDDGENPPACKREYTRTDRPTPQPYPNFP